MIERDFELLRLLSERERESGSEWLEASEVEAAAAQAGMEHDDFKESLQVLRLRRLIDAETGISGNLLDVEVTPIGFDTYALRYVDDYEAIFRRAGRWLFEHRDDHLFNTQLAAAIDVDQVFANHIVRVFGSRGWVRYGSIDMAGAMPVYDMSPELARLSNESDDETMEAR